MIERIKDIYQRIKYLLFVAPLLMAWYGYYAHFGYSFWESFYAAAGLYFVNPIIEETDSLILVSEILAVFVTANFIIVVAQNLFGGLGHIMINRYADSTAVYGEPDMVAEYILGEDHAYAGRRYRRHLSGAKNVVIMYENDLDNINFINDNEAALKNKQLYVQLKDVDSFLLGKNAANIHYFNTYELIARKFWKDYPLDYRQIRQCKSYKIAVIGFGQVGRAVTRYGILENIFALDQAIEYHLFGADRANADFLSGLELMNMDAVVIHEEQPDEAIAFLKTMDRVIVIDDKDMVLTQELLYEADCPEIFYYTEDSVDMTTIFASEKITAFGDVQEILNDRCIRRESLLRVAKLFNYGRCEV